MCQAQVELGSVPTTACLTVRFWCGSIVCRCMSCTSSCGSTGNDITTPSDTPKQQTGSSLEVIHYSASVLLQAQPSATEKLLYATSSNGNMPGPPPSCAVVPPMMLPVTISCSSLLFIRVRERIHYVSMRLNLTFNFR